MLGYVLLVWLVLVMRFEETLKDVRLPPSLRTTLRNYRGLFSSRHFLSFAAIGWLNYTLVVVAISLMPFIMQVQLGLTSEEYALWALLPAVGLMCGGFSATGYGVAYQSVRYWFLRRLSRFPLGCGLYWSPRHPF